MKRIMSIQDISCIGKCSCGVALPIISSMGIECAIVPTAVLSTHTMFSGFTFRDLTDDMVGIKEHWLSEGFKFDAIYSGYLGSTRQIDIVSDFFDTFGKGITKIVDPAMADNGKLYAGFDEDFALEMTRLCSKADIILPNISEASFILGEEYPGEDASIEHLQNLLIKLSKLGPKHTVITGVNLGDDKFGFIGYDSAENEFYSYSTKKVHMKSHGTGDVFASTFTGALTRGKNIYDALTIAADFTSECIADTYNDPEAVNYGVNFETQIPFLLKRLELI